MVDLCSSEQPSGAREAAADEGGRGRYLQIHRFTDSERSRNILNSGRCLHQLNTATTPPTPNQKHFPTPSFIFCPQFQASHAWFLYSAISCHNIWFGLDLYLVLWTCHFMPCCILRWTLERLCRQLYRGEPVGGWHDWQIPPFPSFSSRGGGEGGQMNGLRRKTAKGWERVKEVNK